MPTAEGCARSTEAKHTFMLLLPLPFLLPQPDRL
jgi:hypothetical protein